MIKESNETPKRKRRTKEEIQAARAAGEVPTKRVKKVVEKVDNQEARVSEDKPIKKVPIEQSVILMSCLNPTVAKVVINSAKENGVEVVLLEDSVLKDYVSRKSTCEDKALETFLSDSTNRINATNKVIQLHNLLSKDENDEDRIFTEQEIVNKTNLSHSKTKKILCLLNTFGLIEFAGRNTEFLFKHSPKTQLNYVHGEVMDSCQGLNQNIIKYRTLLDSLSISREEKNELYKAFIEDIKRTVIKY